MTRKVKSSLATVVSLAAASAVLLSAATASAQGPIKVQFKVTEPKPGKVVDGKAPPAGMPFLRATIVAQPGLVAEDFVVKEVDAEPAVEVPSSKSVIYRDSDEPLALVILIEGNEGWMGNETYADSSGDDPEEVVSVYNGAFTGLGPAIEALAKSGPIGSEAAVLIYADGKTISKQPMGDATKLAGSSLGQQKDYEGVISRPFLVGVTESWKILTNKQGFRKVLVVFGDGFDDRADIDGDLRKIIGDLKAADVEVYTVHYSGPAADDAPKGQQNMKKLGYAGDYSATSRDNFLAFSNKISEFIGAKYYVDFPGDDLPLDGEEHEFILTIKGKQDSEPQLIKLPVFEKPVVTEGSLWWLWLLLVVALVILLLIVIIAIRRRPKREPPMAEPEPIIDTEPKRTMMINLNATSEYPVVGWIVPLSGDYRYQTFKLLQGETKIGSGGESHILIQDGFISTDHAEIVCKQSGFVLNDTGSTNGTFVNDKQITTHELVDNDSFVIGKTPFKFKSIN